MPTLIITRYTWKVTPQQCWTCANLQWHLQTQTRPFSCWVRSEIEFTQRDYCFFALHRRVGRVRIVRSNHPQVVPDGLKDCAGCRGNGRLAGRLPGGGRLAKTRALY